MKLTDEEKAMLAGEQGPARQWAIRHQIAVGDFFDAPDFVAVGQAHIMADTESLGEAGVAWLEGVAALPRAERTVRIPTITEWSYRATWRMRVFMRPSVWGSSAASIWVALSRSGCM